MAVPAHLSPLRAQAFAALQQKRDADAAEMLTRYLDGVPDDREAELALAVARCGQGRFGPALVIFDRHLEKEPRSPTLHFNKATALERMGKKFEAIKTYEQVLKLKPDHAKARQRLEALTGAKPKPVPAAITAPRPVVAPPPKPLVAPPPAEPESEEIPEVVAVDDDEPVEVEAMTVAEAPARKKDRWIHPLWLAGLFLCSIGIVTLAGTIASAYAAGRVTGELLLANILLLAGIQALHDARRGKKNRPAALGYVLVGLGGFAILGSISDPFLAKLAKQRADERAAADEKAYLENIQAQQAEARARFDAAAAKHKKDAAEQLEKAIQELRSGDRRQILSALLTIQTTRYYDRRAEVAPLLEGLLSNADSTIRRRTIETLAQWGTEDSIPKLNTFLNDKNPIIRGAAQNAIEKIKSR